MAAVNLPVPVPARAKVLEYLELAPGVPYSEQLLEDMTKDGCIDAIHTDIPGFERISCRIETHTKARKNVQKTLYAFVGGREPGGGPDKSHFFGGQFFPHTNGGMKQAIEFLQRKMADIRRRGFCTACESPCKRLRLSGADACSNCLLKKATQ